MAGRQGDPDPTLEELIDAALVHVAFDGWSEEAFRAAAADADIPLEVARASAPRGGLDLAVGFHRRADRALFERLAAEDLASMRFRDRVAHAICLRLELVAPWREAVRRAASLFALPQNAPLGAALVWETADTIWRGLGDTADDVNWYTKRASLSAVHAAAVLYWLGDETPDGSRTRAFVDRRIDEVMRVEALKARLGENPVLRRLASGPLALLGRVRAPRPGEEALPGRWRGVARPAPAGTE
ncbi:MAG: COQ9 family protein [Alphaproteobacteria bacterium]|nr:MAG: COQ9 family protein [Alphaproteobacteria bacterium]